jgi:hypothetical protein
VTVNVSEAYVRSLYRVIDNQADILDHHYRKFRKMKAKMSRLQRRLDHMQVQFDREISHRRDSGEREAREGAQSSGSGGETLVETGASSPERIVGRASRRHQTARRSRPYVRR